MKKYILYSLLTLLIISCSDSYNGELLLVEPESVSNFQFPYFLFIPDHVSQNDKTFVIVEPNNSGFADDNLQKHIEKAKRTATRDFYIGNYLARKFQYPLIVPVFPRSKTNWKIYTHALDRDVMLQKDNPLERLDNQLIAMFDDARTKLAERDIRAQDRFLLTGFSASGTFANRFTLLHPDKVLAVAAGGLNGLLMLPLDSLDNEPLIYPVGTDDMEQLTNEPFQKKDFLNTPQFYFMGQLDDNDAVPYDDAFDQDERSQIFRLLGEQMLSQRWENCKQIYMNAGVNARIKTYPNTGHEHPDQVKDEIFEFFGECINSR